MRSHTRTAATSSPPSSKNSNTRQQHPHLSGAYNRSIVKQLSSSSSTARFKGQHLNTAMRSTPHDQQQTHQDDQKHKLQDHQEQARTTPAQPVQVKKQVRRRLHASRLYQERLLNVAEARREIVTALKIHRATMRQSKDQQEQQLLQLQQQQQVQVPLQEQSQGVVGTTATITPMSTVSYDAFFSNDHLLNSPLAHLMVGTSYSSSSTLPCLTPVALAPANGGLDHLACSLPAQPLGLDLSFQGFNGFVYDVENSNNSFDRPLIRSSLASSCSAYSSPSAAMASHGSPAVDTAENAPSQASLHPVLEDEEMAAICSIGERHGVEWSNTVDVATPAWWSKLPLDQSTEDGGELGAAAGQEGGTVGAMEDVVGMPAGWLCDGLGEQGMITESSKPDGVLEMHLDGDHYYCHQGTATAKTSPCRAWKLERLKHGTGSGSHDHDRNMHYSMRYHESWS